MNKPGTAQVGPVQGSKNAKCSKYSRNNYCETFQFYYAKKYPKEAYLSNSNSFSLEKLETLEKPRISKNFQKTSHTAEELKRGLLNAFSQPKTTKKLKVAYFNGMKNFTKKSVAQHRKNSKDLCPPWDSNQRTLLLQPRTPPLRQVVVGVVR